LGGVCRLFPKMYDALAIVRPDTVIRWHRAGFRSYWRWKSSRRCGRPTVPLEIRRLIREMSIANRELGIDVGQTSVAKYMARRRGPPSQGWRHSSAIMPTASRRWICSACRRSGPWPAADPVVWGHRPSDSRMDRQSAHSGLRLGANPPLPVPVGNSILLATDIESGDAPALCGMFVV
jgi:hypothetical protein